MWAQAIGLNVIMTEGRWVFPEEIRIVHNRYVVGGTD